MPKLFDKPCMIHGIEIRFNISFNLLSNGIQFYGRYQLLFPKPYVYHGKDKISQGTFSYLPGLGMDSTYHSGVVLFALFPRLLC